MRVRTLALLAMVAGATAVLACRRRRSGATTQPVVQLGLRGGAVRTLAPADPLTIELETLAAGVRDSFPGGS